MSTLGKADAAVDSKEKPKRTWTLRKKLLVFGSIALVIIIGLAVGLGVGLTRRGGGDDDDDGENDDNDSGSGQGPDRKSTWRPKVEEQWQIVLKSAVSIESKDDIDPNVPIYDLDLYDNDVETFRTLQDAGKKVICYFSAGSWEDWRADKDDFDKDDLGKPLDGWPDEKWLKLSSTNVRDIMKKRIKTAWQKGCDAIDPDNVDGYQNDNGLGLTKEDSVDFMKFLSEEAAKYKMSIGLKNAGDIIPDVLKFVDFSVNEQCIQYSECDTFSAFIDADKPVFNIEYPAGAPKVAAKVSKEICSKKGNATGTEGFSTVIKTMDLNGWVEYCDGKTYETSLSS